MVKDKNKPRGKMSSYAYYVQISRRDLNKKNPGQSVTFANFSKTCSEGWRDLKREDKKKYEDMARTDMDRYKLQMKSYVPPKGSRKKKLKDPDHPKRPASAFFVFIGEKRAKIKEENPGISVGDIAKVLGKMWTEQSPEDKAPYEKKAAEFRDKYNEEMVAYREAKKNEPKSVAAKKSAPRRPAARKAVVKKVSVDEDDEYEDDQDDEIEGRMTEDEDDEGEEEDDSNEEDDEEDNWRRSSK